MKTLRLKDGDAFLIRWGLSMEISQCEDFAAIYFAAGKPQQLRDILNDMRQCHELRHRLRLRPK